MTLAELPVPVSLLTSAVAGGTAGSQAGFLACAAGAVGGALAGGLASVLTVGLTGAVAACFAPKADSPSRRPPGRLSEAGFFLFMSPILLAPVWTALLVYRTVDLVIGT